MYHFNPIEDCSLFENMETQYLYNENDMKKEGIIKYVYWYEVDYRLVKDKNKNDKYKRFILKRDSSPIKGNCNVPEGVTSIGRYCFIAIKSLTSIQLPSTLIIIGDKAFSLTGLSIVEVPKKCRIEHDAFYSSCEFIRK